MAGYFEDGNEPPWGSLTSQINALHPITYAIAQGLRPSTWLL